jgi:hypothetical protein
VVGLGASAGAFLAFGLTPLTTAPTANADEFDAIIDPILNTLISSVDHSWAAFDPSWAAVDPSAAAVDPSASADVGGVTQAAAVDAGGATHALSAATSTTTTTTTDPCNGVPCEISKNDVVVENTCLIGGVQECTAFSANQVGDTATAIGAGSSAYAEGGPGDTAYATLGGEAIAKGTDDEATAEGPHTYSATWSTG